MRILLNVLAVARTVIERSVRSIGYAVAASRTDYRIGMHLPDMPEKEALSKFGHNAKIKAEAPESGKHPCPCSWAMGEFSCLDKTQCWEPCGELGHSEAHARAVVEGPNSSSGSVAG